VSKEKKRITTSEAAEILGISTGRVRKLIMDGIIKDVVKFGRDNALSENEIKSLKETERPTGRPKKETGKE
jgi:excisionase family DNA binding protein